MDNTGLTLNSKKTKKPVDKKKKVACIATFVVGMIMLIAGAVFLAVKLSEQPEIADGEYLVAAENWVLEDASDQVIWDFTEMGKGALTTDAHDHDYEFVWELEDGKLLIKTDWLYDLENEYDYKLDQNSGVLTLTDDDAEYVFVAQP